MENDWPKCKQCGFILLEIESEGLFSCACGVTRIPIKLDVGTADVEQAK